MTQSKSLGTYLSIKDFSLRTTMSESRDLSLFLYNLLIAALYLVILYRNIMES
jgi:hypothetical protein